MKHTPHLTTSMRFELHPPTPITRSARSRTVARWFGLTIPSACTDPIRDGTDLSQLLPAPGQITLVTGPSGAGKSSLLRAMRSANPSLPWIDLNRIELRDRALVDCFGRRCSIERALALLNRVGLSDAWTYLRTPDELSDGQRWRLRLALGLWQSQRRRRDSERIPILLADEFAALLDRVTAAVVARALRKTISAAAPPLRAVVATSHDDLLKALAADVHVHCDFGAVDVERLRT